MSLHVNESGVIKGISVKLDGFNINGFERIYYSNIEIGTFESSGGGPGVTITTPRPLYDYLGIAILHTVSVNSATSSSMYSYNMIMYFVPKYGLDKHGSANKETRFYKTAFSGNTVFVVIQSNSNNYTTIDTFNYKSMSNTACPGFLSAYGIY